MAGGFFIPGARLDNAHTTTPTAWGHTRAEAHPADLGTSAVQAFALGKAGITLRGQL